MAKDSGSIYSPDGSSLSAANQNYNTLANQNTAAVSGTAPQVAGQVSNLTSQYQSNPYAAGAQTGANAAGAYGTGTVVPQQQQGASSLAALGGQNAGYVGQALQTGFDPNNALYNRGFQQNQDQTNATAAMNGVAGTPYAAGVANDSNRNFNLDWLASQQAREQAGANTASTLTGAANTAYGGASSLGQQAIQTQTAASGLPSSTYQQNIMSALQELIGGNTATGGAVDNANTVQQQILSYLGYGTNATTTQQKEADQTNQGLGALFGLNTGGGGTLGGDALGFLGL